MAVLAIGKIARSQGRGWSNRNGKAADLKSRSALLEEMDETNS
jgi:hypothetical protein